MVAFSRALPQQFSQPLPEMMAQLTPSSLAQKTTNSNKSQSPTAIDIRRLADAVAAWHIYSPLGICLRRSLLRYHFLREVDTPVTIIFGARFKNRHEGGGIGGHAWLTLDGAPYYERPADYEGFVAMYVYPVDSDQEAVTLKPSIENPKSEI
jgi:hypothetical protein